MRCDAEPAKKKHKPSTGAVDSPAQQTPPSASVPAAAPLLVVATASALPEQVPNHMARSPGHDDLSARFLAPAPVLQETDLPADLPAIPAAALVAAVPEQVGLHISAPTCKRLASVHRFL